MESSNGVWGTRCILNILKKSCLHYPVHCREVGTRQGITTRKLNIPLYVLITIFMAKDFPYNLNVTCRYLRCPLQLRTYSKEYRLHTLWHCRFILNIFSKIATATMKHVHEKNSKIYSTHLLGTHKFHYYFATISFCWIVGQGWRMDCKIVQ